MRAVLLLCCLALPSACASDDAGQRTRPDAPAAEPVADEATADDEPAENERLKLPSTWDEVATRFEFLCPGPLFELEQSSTVEILGHTFERLGSTWKRTEPLEGPLVVGLIGAPKDSAEATRANMKRAAKRFRKAGATLVLVNGDLAEDEELPDVMLMLGEVFTEWPVAVHAGNIEWAGAFTNAFVKAHKLYPQLINLNWVRHLDLGRKHLLSLPGYYDHRFTRSGACRYAEADLKGLRALAHRLRDRGELVVLTSHGPPLSRGADAIDFAHEAGNVGDERITSLLLEEDVRFGLFSHIIEAGGRATAELKRGTPLKLPTGRQERLYVNSGSSGSYPWLMHGGRNSEGLAMIVTIDDDGAEAERLTLR
jgi:hypothetical protein